MNIEYQSYCTQCLRKFYSKSENQTQKLEDEITQRLVDSVREWRTVLSPEKSKAFLFQLIGYDEDQFVDYIITEVKKLDKAMTELWYSANQL
jgi:hypothetical protein